MPKIATVVLLCLFAQRAPAAVIVTVGETGGDVVWNSSSGSLNLWGWSNLFSFDVVPTPSHRFRSLPEIISGSPDRNQFGWGLHDGSRSELSYYGYLLPALFEGPSSFGTSNTILSSSSAVGGGYSFNVSLATLPISPILILPTDYVSGSMLPAGSAIYPGHTIASLGLTPGTYTWTWSIGTASIDSITLNIIPEPSPSLLFLLVLGGGVVRRHR